MNEAVKVLSENYVDEYCTITTVTGPSTRAYLYDQKPDTQFVSSEGTEVITVAFKNWQGSDLSRTFDRIILLNTNFASITADYWGYDPGLGYTWLEIPEATLTLTTPGKMVEIVTPITTTKFRITVTETQPIPSQQRKLGELKICRSILSLTALTSFARNDDQKAGAYRLAGGSLVAWREYTKAGGTLSIEDIDKASVATLLPYFKTANFITLVFYSVFDITEVYEFSITSPPNYTIDRKAEVYSLSMELKEK